MSRTLLLTWKRERCDAAARFGELFPAYQELAANISR
jgi:hypothetical protein